MTKKILKLFILICLLFSYKNVHAEIIEGVLFKSQVPPGSWDKTLNCGQTSMSIANAYYNNLSISEGDIKNIDIWLNEKFSDPIRDFNGYYTNTRKLKTLCSDYFNMEYCVINSGENLFDFLKEQINLGNLSILQVRVKMKLTKVPHFMVFLGYDDEFVYFNDPGQTKGNYVKFEIQNFLEVWENQNFHYLLFQKNNENEDDGDENNEIIDLLKINEANAKENDNNKNDIIINRNDDDIIENDDDIMINENDDENIENVDDVDTGQEDCSITIGEENNDDVVTEHSSVVEENILINNNLEETEEYGYITDDNILVLGPNLRIDLNYHKAIPVSNIINNDDVEANIVRPIDENDDEDGNDSEDENDVENENDDDENNNENENDGNDDESENENDDGENEDEGENENEDDENENEDDENDVENDGEDGNENDVENDNDDEVENDDGNDGNDDESENDDGENENEDDENEAENNNLFGELNSNIILTSEIPYTINSEFIVPENVKLTIMPGTIILFGMNGALLIEGELESLGSSDDMIIFTTNKTENPVENSWKWIKIRNGGKATFNWSIVEYGGYDYFSGEKRASIIVESAFLNTNNLYIDHIDHDCIKANFSYLNIKNSSFKNSRYALNLYNSEGSIENSLFDSNVNAFVINNSFSDLILENNYINNSLDYSIKLINAIPTIINMHYLDNKYDEIFLDLDLDFGTYVLSSGLYYVLKINLHENTNFTISPGCIFKSYNIGYFSGSWYISSNIFNAIGTNDSPIIFDSYYENPSLNQRWGKLNFYNNDFLNIENVTIKNGGRDYFLGKMGSPIYLENIKNINAENVYLYNDFEDDYFYKNNLEEYSYNLNNIYINDEEI